MPQLIAISGSLRQASFNTALLRAAIHCVPPTLTSELITLNDIPLYNGDLEEAQGVPQAVQTLKDKIANCDGLLLSTPEYNHGIPGVFKNTIDWLTRPPEDIKRVFHGRKVGLIGVSAGRMGTTLAQAAWLPTLRFLNTYPYFGQQLQIGGAFQTFNQQGELIDDAIQKLLQQYMAGFMDFIAS